MNNPLVSVIIPAYNASSTIVRSVESVTGQTFTNREIIIVDDGSTDNLLEVLEPYPVRIVSQANMGAAAARNHGSRVAKGDLLAFLDADDFWHPRKLQKQVDAMKKYPDARYCVTNSCKLTLCDLDSGAQWAPTSEDSALELLDFPVVFANPYFGTPGVLMPKDLFESKGGFNENLVTAEDVDLWLRAAYGGFVLKVPEVLFCIVLTESGLSAKFLDRTYYDNVQVINQFCKRYPDFMQAHQRVVSDSYARVYCDWGSAALSRREFSLAKEKLILSIKSKPTFRSLYLLSKTLFSK